MPRIVVDLLPWELTFWVASGSTVVLGAVAAWRRRRHWWALAGVAALTAAAPWVLQPNFADLLRRASTTNVAATDAASPRAELRPLVVAAAPAATLAAAQRAVQQLGWAVLDQDDRGLHAAVPVGPFTDDLRVALTPAAAGTTVNVISAARVGKGDLGANRRHVVQFLLVLRDQLGTAQP